MPIRLSLRYSSRSLLATCIGVAGSQMGPSEQQLAKLSAALTVPFPETSHQLVRLRFSDGSEMEARKGVLAMASAVLSEALQIDPQCSELKVDGTADIWQQLMATVLYIREQQLQPNDVQAILLIAHKYNMTVALKMLTSCIQEFKFTPFDGPLYVMKWLSLARMYQAPGIAAACTRYILSQMGQLIHWKSAGISMISNIPGLVQQFKPGHAASIDAPADTVATLTLAYEALRDRMGL